MRGRPLLTPRRAAAVIQSAVMNLAYVVGGLLVVGLLIYLAVALLKPEWLE